MAYTRAAQSLWPTPGSSWYSGWPPASVMAATISRDCAARIMQSSAPWKHQHGTATSLAAVVGSPPWHALLGGFDEQCQLVLEFVERRAAEPALAARAV